MKKEEEQNMKNTTQWVEPPLSKATWNMGRNIFELSLRRLLCRIFTVKIINLQKKKTITINQDIFVIFKLVPS